MGHYCRICGSSKPNEKFSGKGHKNHICKECARKPKEEIDAIQTLDDLYGFLRQSRISENNVKWMKTLINDTNTEIRETANTLLQVATIASGKKKRWKKIHSGNEELYKKCLKLGFTEHILYGDDIY